MHICMTMCVHGTCASAMRKGDMCLTTCRCLGPVHDDAARARKTVQEIQKSQGSTPQILQDETPPEEVISNYDPKTEEELAKQYLIYFSGSILFFIIIIIEIFTYLHFYNSFFSIYEKY